MYRVSPFVSRFAKALLCGTAVATLWVNIAPASYYDALEFRLIDLPLPVGLSPFPPSVTLSLNTALPGGAMADAARLGLAISLLAGVGALLLRRGKAMPPP